MRINVVTMFPEYFEGPLGVSIVGRAIKGGQLEVNLVDLRDYGIGKHRQLDDAPFGGGAGMVMMVEPLDEAMGEFAESHRVFFTPAGTPMTQSTLDRWAGLDDLTLLCGRYEGVDQRVIDNHVDEEVSAGDYVVAGGEAVAALAIEGVARLLAGVLGNPESTASESFRDDTLEEPVYTRPAVFKGWAVPDILLSGDHAAIEQWRRDQRIQRTRQRRPDLAEDAQDGDS